MNLPALFLTIAQTTLPAITTLGRDVVVSSPGASRVVAVFSNVRVDGRVSGDVVVWGADVSFGAEGFVEGSVSVFGGDVHAPAGRPLPVRGAVATPGALLPLYLAEMKRAPWAAGDRAPALRGLRLIALSGWLGLSLVLLYFFGSPFARAAAAAEGDWTGSLMTGALGVLTLFLAAAAVLSLLPSAISAPIAIVLAGFAVAAKVFGMGALFLLLGQKIVKSVSPARRPAALAVGFAILGALSLLPILGALIWSAASVVAVGIALLSRFGRPRMRVAVHA